MSFTNGNILTIGSPGGGKSEGAASDAMRFDGALITLEPHPESLGEKMLLHAEGNVLFDKLSDFEHRLGYGLLTPSKHPNPKQRERDNAERIAVFEEIMMRRRKGDLAAAPLMQEWVGAILLLYISQDPPKPISMLPYGFLPDTEEFRVLVRDCPLPQTRSKFLSLERLTIKGRRSEIGSGQRLLNETCLSQAFLDRCDATFSLGSFIQSKGKLILEGGGIDGAMRAIFGGISVLASEHCESRPVKYPPLRIDFEECTNARSVGKYEINKLGENRKFNYSYRFSSQWLDYSDHGFLQNFGRKEVYRCEDYDLARQMATILSSSYPSHMSRTDTVAHLTKEIMNLKPGWRFVADLKGARKEYVKMLTHPVPDWPGLREKYLEEKLCKIYARPEYGDPETPLCSTSFGDSPPPLPNSNGSSAAELWTSE